MDILNKKFRYQTGLEKIDFSEKEVKQKLKIVLCYFHREIHTVARRAAPGDLGLMSHPKDFQQKFTYNYSHPFKYKLRPNENENENCTILIPKGNSYCHCKRSTS